MRIFIAALAAAILAPVVSAAALEVRHSVVVEGRIDDVWRKAGGWCAISKWHPAVKTCEEIRKGRARRRKLTVAGGGVIRETLTKASRTGYSYRMDDSLLPVEHYRGTFAAHSARAGKVTVTWVARFKPKKGTKPKDAAKAVERFISRGLEALRAGK